MGKVACIPSKEEMANVLLLSSMSILGYIKVGYNIIKTTDMKILSIETGEGG